MWDWGIFLDEQGFSDITAASNRDREQCTVTGPTKSCDLVDLSKGETTVNYETYLQDSCVNTSSSNKNGTDYGTTVEESVFNGRDVQSDLRNWKRIMDALALPEKEAEDLRETELVGKEFTSLEDAELFFNLYAKLTGFSVRKGHKRRKADGNLRLREWLCCREGARMKKHMQRIDRIREAKPLTRVGCKVRLRVSYHQKTNKWRAREFKTKHSHELVQDRHIQFLRSNRGVTEGALNTAMAMRSAGIRTCHIMSYMAGIAGGYDKVPFSSKDLGNRISTYEQVELSEADAARAIGYLSHKHGTELGFFGKYTYDEYRRLETLFWADSVSRRDYAYFGHAIAFDTTYRTNDYGKPLLVIVGINHHFRSTVVAFAILHNETTETYKWVIETFLECMNMVMPETVMTDGDNSMRAAVAELMPTACHRICSWHISTKAVQKVKDPHFQTRLKRLILRYYTKKQFEDEWALLIKDYGLEHNSWASWLHQRRMLWAEAYVREHFFGGMTTTQRCESMNRYVKRNLPEKVKLWQFVRLLDLSLSRMRHKESKEDFVSMNTFPVLGSTNMPEIEEHAATIYTRKMFQYVRQEIKREGRYMPRCEEDDGVNEVVWKLTKYSSISSHYRFVLLKKKENKFECTCNTFPSKGYPCRHIFAVMKLLQMKQIPPSMILRRWTMQAKAFNENWLAKSDRCNDNEWDETSRFGHVIGRCTELACLASKNNYLLKLATEQIGQVASVLTSASKAFDGEDNKRRKMADSEEHVRNPGFTKTKGAPRSKTYGGGRTRRCSNCNKSGHNKSTCQRTRTKDFNSPTPSNSQFSNNEDGVYFGDDNDSRPPMKETTSKQVKKEDSEMGITDSYLPSNLQYTSTNTTNNSAIFGPTKKTIEICNEANTYDGVPDYGNNSWWPTGAS